MFGFSELRGILSNYSVGDVQKLCEEKIAR
jgi:hypothetical protein